MFKSCGSLFDLSMKLGSVVIGLGLAGVLFSGQVSAAPHWNQSDIRHLACVVRDFVEAVRNGNINYWIWDMVATEFNRRTNQERTSHACYKKWGRLAKQYEEFRAIYNPSTTKSWTDDESERLVNIVRGFVDNRINFGWDTVAAQFNSTINDPSRYRTPYACQIKYHELKSPRFMGSSRQGGKFTPAEDSRLLELVREHGDNEWETVAELLRTGRTSRQCRERYRNYLEPRAKPFAENEDINLIKLVQQCRDCRNLSWRTIAKGLGNGRTAIQCRERYKRLLKNRNVTQSQTNTALSDSLPANTESENTALISDYDDFIYFAEYTELADSQNSIMFNYDPDLFPCDF